MKKGIFISATGTDVGKTYISALIMKKLLAENVNATYFKAALSGAEKIDNKLYLGDAEYVIKTSGLKAVAEDLVCFAYETAVSPHLAARLEGVDIDFDVIKKAFNKAEGNNDFVLAEGSGGLVCPLNENTSLMLEDVIKMTGFDVILVADSRLGTINSTVLSCFYAENRGINIIGIVLNNYDKDNFMHIDNKKQIEKITKIPVIATVSENDDKINLNMLDFT